MKTLFRSTTLQDMKELQLKQYDLIHEKYSKKKMKFSGEHILKMPK